MIKSHGLVDFHCHLDLYPDLSDAIHQAENAKVFTLAVTTTPRAWARNHALTRETTYIRAALGLHPQLVDERASELALWETLLPETGYVGEVGLDASPRFYRSLDQQKEIFAYILRRCAQAGGKIVTVHSVRAIKAVLDHIERHLPPDRGQIVLHWFTGSKSEAKRATELGCYFSVNKAMLDNARHRAVVASVPLERLLTETDGPFTSTAGCPSTPADVRLVIEGLSELFRIEASAAAATVRTNLRRLLESAEHAASS